jgi:hypothetical protein
VVVLLLLLVAVVVVVACEREAGAGKHRRRHPPAAHPVHKVVQQCLRLCLQHQHQHRMGLNPHTPVALHLGQGWHQH